MNRRTIFAAALAAAALAGAGCSGRVRDDPMMRLSAEESMVEGRRLLEAEKYGRARPYFQHAFEVEPNSKTGREALLLVAETLFHEGTDADLIQAEAKYRDYQNRFPTSDRAAYVQFQIAESLAQRVARPDRDQATTRKAVEAYEDLVRLYPTSEYAGRAQESLARVREQLGEHEYMVAMFYLRFGLPAATALRLEGLLDQFPDYGGRDKALYHLALAYQRLERADDAASTLTRLRSEHPQSQWIAEIPKVQG
jgi:outer membrane protein assembly factor BamD